MNSANMEGISAFCEQLDIDPMEDTRILVLLWKMGANEKPGRITKEEWISGCHKVQVDSVAKFQALLPALETGFLDQPEFKEFYKVRRSPKTINKQTTTTCNQQNAISH
jgi:hypothetical protein